MELIDALKTIEAHLQPNMAIGMWMLPDGKLMCSAALGKIDFYADSPEKLAIAAEAIKTLSQYPLCIEALSK